MLKILDTTLRDGNYAVDFKFTAKDVTLIASALDQCGMPMIEIGHGLGLNAGGQRDMLAASTDIEILAVAAEAIKNSQWGMFFIPEIGRLEDIGLAARHGMKFIRIGTNVTKTEEAQKYVVRAKELGLLVSCNFMKTYALPPDQVGAKAAEAQKFGADIVSVVDSAGGFLPEDVERYFKAIRRQTDIPLGYHGHDNLGLALANTLKAIDSGAAVVDASLRGLGRDAGNAATETLLFILKRQGLETGLDPIRLLDIAEKFIDPLLQGRGAANRSLSIVSGYAQFHSAFLAAILERAAHYNVDPREMIIDVCQRDKVNPSGDLVDDIARALARRPVPLRRFSPIIVGLRPEQETSREKKARRIIDEIEIISKKFSRPSALNVAQSIKNPPLDHISTTIYDGPAYAVGTLEAADLDFAASVTAYAAEKLDYILLDCDVKTPFSLAFISRLKETTEKILIYSDVECWSRSLSRLVVEALDGKPGGRRIAFIGDNQIARACLGQLELYGFETFQITAPASSEITADAVVLCQAGLVQPCLVKTARFLVDGMIGLLTQDEIADFTRRNIDIYRPDMRAVIQAELDLALGVKHLTADRGYRLLAGTPVAAGGLVAPLGTVIVDSLSNPKVAYGLSDGLGFLLSPEKWTEGMREDFNKVELEMLDSLNKSGAATRK